MSDLFVDFTFHSGLTRDVFSNARLSGSWDSAGRLSSQWTDVPMQASRDETGCAAFTASVAFDANETGTTFQWGVIADLPGAPNAWVIATEVPDPNSSQRYRSFTLTADETRQDYSLCAPSDRIVRPERGPRPR